MSSHTEHIVQQLKDRIDKTRRMLYRRDLLLRSVKAISIAGLFVTAIIFIESLASLTANVRTVLVTGVEIMSFLLMVWLLWKPILRTIGILAPLSDRAVARIIGESFGSISDRLENMLDLADLVKSKEFNGSPELVEVSLEHFAASTKHIRFSDAVSFQGFQRLARTMGAVGITMTALAVIPGTRFHDAARRMIYHQEEYQALLPFTINVKPGTMDIVKGASVTIEATLISEENSIALPDEMILSFAEHDVKKNSNIVIRKDSAGTFRYLFPSLKQTTHYRLISGDVSSEQYRLNVIDRPFIRSLSVTLIPPAYTKLNSETLQENIGDILAFPGTRIYWNIIPSKRIASAAVKFKDGTSVAMNNTGSGYSAEFSPIISASYTIVLRDADGVVNTSAIEYKITILNDEYPTISVITPGKNVDLTEEMMLPVDIAVTDDFGLSKLLLKYHLVQSKYSAGEKEVTSIVLFDTLTTKESVLQYDWDLTSLGLVPEDVVEYYAEVFDNDVISGPKSSKSQSYLIRLPSLEEVFSDAEKTQEDAAKILQESLNDAQELKKDLQELSNDLKRNQQMDWQKQKKAEDVLKKYEELQKKIEEVNKSIDAMTQNLQQNNTLSKETLEKYLELQKTLSELDSPEFQKAMKRMQDAMQRVSPEQMREAMEQAQFNEEQFRQNIERTMNLLKRIQIEQKVDEMLKRIEAMKAKQEELNSETKRASENDAGKAEDLAQKQEEVGKQLSQVQKELDALEKKMEEFPKDMPMENMDAAQEAADDHELQDALKKSSQQLRSQQMERAQSSQQQVSNGIAEMQKQVSELQEQLLNNQLQKTMNALRKAMQDLLKLSQKQERLKNQSKSLDPNSQQFRDIAQQQQNLQGDLNNVANALADLSQESFAVTPEMGKQIGRAMGQMNQAMSGIEQRNSENASAQQNEVMATLNKAATEMQNAMQQMQQQGGKGGGSLMQQLRGMAMQQQQINAQTQQLGERQGLSQQQKQEMGRLARQQDAVRKSLDQLQREAQGTPEKEKIMGDLDKITSEMKEVVEQLQQNQVNPNTRQQQERILSRLLQAQRSMRERDYEQKRKSVSGISPFRKNQQELPLQPNESKISKDLRRAQESGYSKDYLDLIRKYYETLERKEQ